MLRFPRQGVPITWNSPQLKSCAAYFRAEHMPWVGQLAKWPPIDRKRLSPMEQLPFHSVQFVSVTFQRVSDNTQFHCEIFTKAIHIGIPNQEASQTFRTRKRDKTRRREKKGKLCKLFKRKENLTGCRLNQNPFYPPYMPTCKRVQCFFLLRCSKFKCDDHHRYFCSLHSVGARNNHTFARKGTKCWLAHERVNSMRLQITPDIVCLSKFMLFFASLLNLRKPMALKSSMKTVHLVFSCPLFRVHWLSFFLRMWFLNSYQSIAGQKRRPTKCYNYAETFRSKPLLVNFCSN